MAAICPYCMVVPKEVGYVVGMYCTGYSSGKVRAPSTFEVDCYCKGDYVECPVYRFRQEEDRQKLAVGA